MALVQSLQQVIGSNSELGLGFVITVRLAPVFRRFFEVELKNELAESSDCFLKNFILPIMEQESKIICGRPLLCSSNAVKSILLNVLRNKDTTLPASVETTLVDIFNSIPDRYFCEGWAFSKMFASQRTEKQSSEINKQYWMRSNESYYSVLACSDALLHAQMHYFDALNDTKSMSYLLMHHQGTVFGEMDTNTFDVLIADLHFNFGKTRMDTVHPHSFE